MNFVQVEFLWFMVIVFVAYWAVQRRVWQNLLLVVASAVFYGWIHPWFLFLLYASALLDFSMGLTIKRSPEYKRWAVAMSMAGNLGMLGFFKYSGFFVENVAGVLEAIGFQANLPTLHIILPVGISFYTFQTMSYTIDVYRGDVEPRSNFLDYLLYVSFFAQLVAGPIERASRLLPQIESPRMFSWDQTRSGVNLALWGGFKKLVIADTLAPYVDRVFVLNQPEGPLIWAATLGFAVQIYADFSGYTDMARGTARMLGFDLVENFDKPYRAATTPEFWRRWHMSLSFWIRDYLLVPLLGTAKQVSTLRFVGATTVAFVLLGFWHGPSWNFILLGLWNAAFMMAYPAIQRQLPGSLANARWGRPVAIVIHNLAFGLPACLMFREVHLDRLVMHFAQNPFASTRDHWIATVVVLGVTVAVLSPLWIAGFLEAWVKPKIEKTPWMLPAQTTLWSVYIVGMFVFYRTTARDFIYFQF